MIFSDVEAGGKIVFPYLKVGVVPRAGTLLYWTTKTNSGMLIQYRMGLLVVSRMGGLVPVSKLLNRLYN